jgi:hypothetical protein
MQNKNWTETLSGWTKQMVWKGIITCTDAHLQHPSEPNSVTLKMEAASLFWQQKLTTHSVSTCTVSVHAVSVHTQCQYMHSVSTCTVSEHAQSVHTQCQYMHSVSTYTMSVHTTPSFEQHPLWKHKHLKWIYDSNGSSLPLISLPSSLLQVKFILSDVSSRQFIVQSLHQLWRRYHY